MRSIVDRKVVMRSMTVVLESLLRATLVFKMGPIIPFPEDVFLAEICVVWKLWRKCKGVNEEV